MENLAKRIFEINNNINNSKFFFQSKCICDKKENAKNIPVYSNDRYKVQIPQILCSECGLIRSQFFMTSEYTHYFYKEIYRDLYTAPNLDLRSFFYDQVERGKKIANFFKKNNISLHGKKILEIGCGAGGILYSLKEQGALVTGCDWDEKYLEYGITKGLNLLKGDLRSIDIESNTYDLIILCHVLEHFSDPINELLNLTSKLSPHCLVYIELPGIFSSYKYYYNPLNYFQSAHCYNFTKKHLNCLCKSVGLDSLSCNEEIHALYKKSTRSPVRVIWPNLSIIIYIYLTFQKCIWILKINPYYWRALFNRYYKKFMRNSI